MTPLMINASGIVKTFSLANEALTVLKSVSLSVPAGQFVSIMGPSGSGKSTLLYLLGGLDRPNGGEIEVAGQPVTLLNSDELAAFRSRTVGFVFQAFHLVPTLTALENAGLPGIFQGMPREYREQRAFELLTALGMADRADHRPSQLSGGQQQRTAIARALFNDPPILMCDEPTGALDSKTGHTVLRLLRALCDRQGKTIVVVTHDAGIAQYADRIVNIRDGRIVDDRMTEERKEPHVHVA